MSEIVFFKDAQANVALLGGKGASLVRLAAAGLHVPPGFVVTTACFNRLAGTMDASTTETLLQAYDQLQAPYVAVRSSATAEDGSSASWAGQLESYLFVDRASLVSSVVKCWESLTSERAKQYAEEHQVTESVSVAVVVQTMVNALSAGVMFTANPVTHSTDELIIEAVWGLGESLVQGLATPESWIITKATGAVVDHQPHYQTEKIVQSGAGVTTTSLADNEQTGDILTEDHRTQLVQAAKDIEQLYGSPQDIEWAIADNQLYILQARPITTL